MADAAPDEAPAAPPPLPDLPDAPEGTASAAALSSMVRKLIGAVAGRDAALARITNALERLEAKVDAARDGSESEDPRDGGIRPDLQGDDPLHDQLGGDTEEEDEPLPLGLKPTSAFAPVDAGSYDLRPTGQHGTFSLLSYHGKPWLAALEAKGGRTSAAAEEATFAASVAYYAAPVIPGLERLEQELREGEPDYYACVDLLGSIKKSLVPLLGALEERAAYLTTRPLLTEPGLVSDQVALRRSRVGGRLLRA